MSLLERLTEALARDAIDTAARVGDEDLVDEVSKSLGDTSPSMQENYLTAVRYFEAEARARKLVEEAAKGFEAGTQKSLAAEPRPSDA